MLQGYRRPRDQGMDETIQGPLGGAPAGGVRAPRVGVILAAGRSERLSKLTGGRSKALVPLGGVALIERSVRTLLEAGLERVVVVVGHQGDQVGAEAEQAAPGRVEVVRAPDWTAGNGASLAAAEHAVRGEELFVLLCGDHMFPPDAFRDLLRTDEPAVLVDRSPPKEAWKEGTRVNIRRGMAIAFSKDLEDPAIDCGVFVLSPEVFDCQRRAAAEGDQSLAGAVTRLSRSGGVRAIPLPPGAWWQDVDTPDDLRVARHLLRRSLGKRTDGPVSRYLNRPISTRITMLLAPFRLNPNFLSFWILLVGLWAAWSLSASRSLVGGTFVLLASMLDGVDGETARLQFRTSRRGALIDDFSDRVVDAAIIAGFCLWLWDGPGRTFRTLVLLASAGGLALFHLVVKDKTARLEVPPQASRTLGISLGGRDTRLFLAAIGSILGNPWLAVGGFFGAYFFSVVRRVASLRHWRRLSPAAVAPPEQVREPA
jgi:1L-myo-inositol 1-phosphate cytidylyltransferase / CDP-L-myo-inositol myo-inositolphosphotransferase